MKKLLSLFAYVGFGLATISVTVLLFSLIDTGLINSLFQMLTEEAGTILIYIPLALMLVFLVLALVIGRKKDVNSTIFNVITSVLLGLAGFAYLIVINNKGFYLEGLTSLGDAFNEAHIKESVFLIAIALSSIFLLVSTVLVIAYRKPIAKATPVEAMTIKEEPELVEVKVEEPVKEENVEVLVDEKEEKVEEPVKKTTVKKVVKKDDSKTEESKKTAPKKQATPKKEKEDAPIKEDEEKVEKKTPKEARRVYHLNKREEDNKWTIVFAGGKRVIKLCDTQKEAIAYVEELCARNGGTYLVHNSKGKNKGRIKAK